MESDVSFSGIGGHDIRLTTLLNANEFLFVRDLSDKRGISQSLLVRELINKERERIAHEELSQEQSESVTADSEQDLHNLVKLLRKALKG